FTIHQMTRAPLIIVSSAAARSQRDWSFIRTELNKHQLTYNIHETRFAGDATEQARAALIGGSQLVAVVGGDGTLSEAAAGFFPALASGSEMIPAPINPEAALAILPAGTGNDFALGLTGFHARSDYWITRLVAYCHRPADDSRRPIDVLYGRADE